MPRDPIGHTDKAIKHEDATSPGHTDKITTPHSDIPAVHSDAHKVHTDVPPSHVDVIEKPAG
jgi:hypothetical protein